MNISRKVSMVLLSAVVMLSLQGVDLAALHIPSKARILALARRTQYQAPSMRWPRRPNANFIAAIIGGILNELQGSRTRGQCILSLKNLGFLLFHRAVLPELWYNQREAIMATMEGCMSHWRGDSHIIGLCLTICGRCEATVE